MRRPPGGGKRVRVHYVGACERGCRICTSVRQSDHSGCSCDPMALGPGSLELLPSRLIGKEPLRSVYDYSAELSRIQKIYGSRTPHREVTELLFQRNGDIDYPKLMLDQCKRRFWSTRQMPVLCPCLVNSCDRDSAKVVGGISRFRHSTPLCSCRRGPGHRTRVERGRVETKNPSSEGLQAADCSAEPYRPHPLGWRWHLGGFTRLPGVSSGQIPPRLS